MKRTILILLLLMIVLTPGMRVYAAETECELIDVNELENAQPEAARTAYGTLKPDQPLNAQRLLDALWNYLSCQSGMIASSAIREGAEILVFSFFAVLCASISKSTIIPMVGAAAIALLSLNSVSSCAAIGKQAIQTLSDYSHVMLPCLTTAAAAGGAWSSSGAKYAASVLFIDFLISAEQYAALPLLYCYGAVSITAQLTQNDLLSAIAGLMKRAVKLGLLFLTICFTSYLAVTGILSGTVDAAAAKAAKAVISGVLPVVGGIMSNASEAILSGAQMLRNGIGVVGMLVILAVCAVPYLTLGCHYLTYRLAGGIAGSLGDHRIGGIIQCIGDIYGFLLGIVSTVSLMLFVSVISLMKTVSL